MPRSAFEDFLESNRPVSDFIEFAVRQLFRRIPTSDLAQIVLVDVAGREMSFASDNEGMDVDPQILMPDVVAQVIRESRRIDGKESGEASDVLRCRGLRAFVCWPIAAGGHRGAVWIANTSDRDAFYSMTLVKLERFATELADAWERVQSRPIRVVPPEPPARHLVGDSPGLRRAVQRAKLFARESFPVLISGPSGSGKEELASLIHADSGRRSEPLIFVSMAAVTKTLAQSELGGHERGAFTGAVQSFGGQFGEANGGTLVLDDIAFASKAVLKLLLRFLSTGELPRVGSTKRSKLDVRIIATTSVPLVRLLREGRITKDLYYRLKGGVIRIPPLKSRIDDLPALVDHFQRRFNRAFAMDSAAWRVLMSHDWSGDVRELEFRVRVLGSLGKAHIGAADVVEELEEDDFDAEGESQSYDDQMAAAEIICLSNARRRGGSWKAAATILKKPYSTIHDRARRRGLLRADESEFPNQPSLDLKSISPPE